MLTKILVTEHMHAGHQFEIHGWLSEDRAKNNTRRLKMTEQKGIQLDCMHIGQIQFNSHILGNIWVLSVHFPFLCVMKPQLIASWRCRQAPNCVRLTQSAATISPSKSPRTPSRLSQGHNAKMSWPVSPRLARVQCWWGDVTKQMVTASLSGESKQVSACETERPLS